MMPSTMAIRTLFDPGTLVRSSVLAPADSNRITAILPKMICSVKFLEPTAIWAPSSSTPSIGPASWPLGTYPPAVPRPHPANRPVRPMAAVVIARRPLFMRFMTDLLVLQRFLVTVRPIRQPSPGRRPGLHRKPGSNSGTSRSRFESASRDHPHQ